MLFPRSPCTSYVVGDGCGELALLVGRTLPPVLRFDRRITGETNCDININD